MDKLELLKKYCVNVGLDIKPVKPYWHVRNDSNHTILQCWFNGWQGCYYFKWSPYIKKQLNTKSFRVLSSYDIYYYYAYQWFEQHGSILEYEAYLELLNIAFKVNECTIKKVEDRRLLLPPSKNRKPVKGKNVNSILKELMNAYV